MIREDSTRWLLSWFEANRRDLPWRGEPRNPYHVWVSEVMLQQTQVRTVVGYFNRWLVRFPDIPALAGAPLDAVLKSWEGLGYYSRARNLHKAAQLLVERYDGKLPHESRELRKLPGIGPYTAAAIASLAFGEDVIAVDGNIRRVVSRLFTLREEVTQEISERYLDSVFRPGQAGRINEALMELGALCCVPAAPICEGCPFRLDCQAHRQGNPEDFPLPRKRKCPPHVKRKGLLILRENNLYLTRRPENGMLGGLWGIPLIEDGLSNMSGIEAVLEDVSHAYTHFRITVTPLVVNDSREISYDVGKGRFVPLGEISLLALSTLDRKIMERLKNYRNIRAKQGCNSLDRGIQRG